MDDQWNKANRPFRPRIVARAPAPAPERVDQDFRPTRSNFTTLTPAGTSGDIDLTLPATRLGTPIALSDDEHGFLRERAGRQLDLTPGDMVRRSVLRLAVASALESRLVHVRRGRLDAFDLPRNPRKVRLDQLAALHRHHAGTAGQAFELAVTEAVRAGNPEVIGPIVKGLSLLRIATPSSLNMMVLGLEKIRAEEAEGFYSALEEMLPDDAVLRTGARGRPASVQTAVANLKQATWSNMGTGTQNPRRDLSQLGRADALLVADSAAVAVSMKITHTAVSRQTAWKDVPLWITTGRPSLRGPTVSNESVGGLPKVVVRLSTDRWVGTFLTALHVVDHALARIDATAIPSSQPWMTMPGRIGQADQVLLLINWLDKNSSLSVAQACERLRELQDPPSAAILLPVMEGSQATTEVRMLDVGPVKRGFREDADDAQVVIGPPQWWTPPPVPIRTAVP